mmetsp:Transcript_15034/g.25131  ORF Transcript_15034/g.25131 Transcript_15034/m.25131 type:complete len:129 (+) Transcript_15034:233-619(+)
MPATTQQRRLSVLLILSVWPMIQCSVTAQRQHVFIWKSFLHMLHPFAHGALEENVRLAHPVMMSWRHAPQVPQCEQRVLVHSPHHTSVEFVSSQPPPSLPIAWKRCVYVNLSDRVYGYQPRGVPAPDA